MTLNKEKEEQMLKSKRSDQKRSEAKICFIALRTRQRNVNLGILNCGCTLELPGYLNHVFA